MSRFDQKIQECFETWYGIQAGYSLEDIDSGLIKKFRRAHEYDTHEMSLMWKAYRSAQLHLIPMIMEARDAFINIVADNNSGKLKFDATWSPMLKAIANLNAYIRE